MCGLRGLSRLPRLRCLAEAAQGEGARHRHREAEEGQPGQAGAGAVAEPDDTGEGGTDRLAQDQARRGRR
ncbi:hypothetical protein GCM10009601_14360 [Streptomyces thermospinosisporus]|uniref:Uncharacterized protein n=1 Tax=Streptomyces thermospinosisporus TaxID=161482 RepID=A0ABP4JGP6_9ACTN